MILACKYDSPLGPMTLAARDDALVGAWFAGQRYYGSRLNWTKGDSAVLCQARQWLDRYFAGLQPMPAELPLCPMGTPFQKAVWQCLLEIPYGQTASYADIDRQLKAMGIKSCPQAVGGAVGHNPISIIIPCHRVLSVGGRLTGYAAGTDKKEKLLNMEHKRMPGG